MEGLFPKEARGDRAFSWPIAVGVSVPWLKESEAMVFTLVHKTDQQPIGCTAIKGIDREASHGEVAIAIMEKEYRGHGYGTEAMKLLLSYAFETIGLATLCLTVFSQNKGAIQVYEKLGSRRDPESYENA